MWCNWIHSSHYVIKINNVFNNLLVSIVPKNCDIVCKSRRIGKFGKDADWHKIQNKYFFFNHKAKEHEQNIEMWFCIGYQLPWNPEIVSLLWMLVVFYLVQLVGPCGLEKKSL